MNDKQIEQTLRQLQHALNQLDLLQTIAERNYETALRLNDTSEITNRYNQLSEIVGKKLEAEIAIQNLFQG